MTVTEKAWSTQKRIEERVQRLGRGKYGRVFRMSRKPENEEYARTSQITMIGILIIGVIGFAILMLATEVAPWLADKLGI